MSNSYNYNPIPPRVWSRVQNQCTYTNASGNDDINYQQVYIPITGETVPQGQANYEMQMFNKGNILQYKGNSSQLTKKQKYSQLAKGFGPNRTKVFATQSQTYTNPNTTGLKRVNSTSYPYPNQIVGAPNNPSGPFQYNVPNPFDCSNNSIQDGGNLVCGTYANPCSGEIIQTGATSATIFNLASASDVPGSSILYWNNNIQTWFPRQRYFMNNSGNKWPQGYKGLVSALIETVPNSPVIVSSNSYYYDINLEWTYTDICSSISGFNLYQNGQLIKTFPYQIKSTTINNLNNCQVYNYYITAFNNAGNSLPSNIVYVTIYVPLAPTITTINQTNTSATINWTPNLNCATITNYLLYENNILIDTLPSTQTTITLNLTNCGTNNYEFYLVSYNTNPNVYSLKSNTFIISVVPLPPTLSGSSTSFTQITLNWTPVITCAPITAWNIYEVTTTPTVIATINDITTLTYVINGLVSGSQHKYCITASYSGGESANSNIVTLTVNSLYTIISGPTPTTVTYGSYTGLVFNYNNLIYPSQTLTTIVFNFSLTIGILMVGGGSSGGAGYSAGPDPGAGGGGGGVINVASYVITVGTTYYITPGYGAIASTGNGAMPNAGGSSLFYTVTSGPNYIYQATGGTNSSGSFNPGAGGNGYYNGQLIQYTNGGGGGLSYNGNQNNGADCSIPSVTLPINVTYNLGGGGGSGDHSSNGGACGNGVGGSLGASGSQTGQSAPPTGSPNSYGGGGGGGTFSSSSYPGGNGGNGVVVLWWHNS